MAIEMIETCDFSQEAQLSVDMRMADLEVQVRFYNAKSCTVNVLFLCRDGYRKSEFMAFVDDEVRGVEASLRIASNFDSLAKQGEYELAEPIMSKFSPEARWIA